MSNEREAAADAAYVIELLALIDGASRQRAIEWISTLAMADRLEANQQAPSRGSPSWPAIYDPENADAHAELFVEACRPYHPAETYFGSDWPSIVEAAWEPEGYRHALLGSHETAAEMSIVLLSFARRAAERLGLPLPLPFDQESLENFMSEWRRQFILTLWRL